MSLVLSLRKDHTVYLGNTKMVVSDIHSAYECEVEIEGKKFTLAGESPVEILPGVNVLVGTPKSPNQSSIIKLAFDAPGVKILREDLYLKASKSKCETCGGSGVLTTTLPCSYCRGYGCKLCNWLGHVKESFKCPDCGN